MCDCGERRGVGLIARVFNKGDVVSTIVGLFDEFESSSDKLYSDLIVKPLKSGINEVFAIFDANLNNFLLIHFLILQFILFYFLLHFIFTLHLYFF